MMKNREHFDLKQADIVTTKYWHALSDGRIQCDLCPRECKLANGQRGLCFVRAAADDQIILTTYGRSSGFAIDPVEKKPLNHFLPGTPILSFGTAGCNLSCKFCQNWDMSKSRQMDTLMSLATPQAIAKAAVESHCRSVAYTYNDPVIFLEYVTDTAEACKAAGVYSVAVTAGYIAKTARKDFFSVIDAANVDLKSFNNDFYYKLTGGKLRPVLDTLEFIKNETSVWLELTTLLIPGENDSEDELDQMTTWVADKLGPDVPMHFTAFHPDYKMHDLSPTPLQTLIRAREIAIKNGIRYAYTGNIHDDKGNSTWCHHCGHCLIGRQGYDITTWSLDAAGKCSQCQTQLPGKFEPQPGNWGSKRLRVVP